MAKKQSYIATLLDKQPLDEVATATGLPAPTLDALKRGFDAVTAPQAIALGKFFNVDPKYILDQQTQEQLAEAGYKPAAPKPARKEHGKSPAFPAPRKRESGSSTF